MMMRWPVQTRCNASFIRSCHRARAGISLLEVVFSIGVVMIGLVGIAALLPVGGSLARKGAVADAAAKAGANAVREFRAREMSNPKNWRWFNTSGAMPPQFTGPVMPNGNATPGMGPGTSFCLDPLFISDADQNSAQELAERNRFPVDRDSPYAMRRVTLASQATANGVLHPLVAEQLFTSADDLVFDRPRDRTLGPEQVFAYQDPERTVPLKRYADCHISWMATIVPKLDTGMNGTDEYIVSVVVFNRRLIAPELTGEAVVGVKEFYSGNPAFSGGDMTLVARDEREENGAEDLELRSGDWVMLSRLKEVYGASQRMQVHRWYRVTHAGEDPVFNQYDNGQWTREVTLIGPDWDPAYPTQVTIVQGVVEVLEKTVRLENTSMWTR